MSNHVEIPLPLWVVENLPVDAKFICDTLEQAEQRAYDGYSCYIKELKKFVNFVDINGTIKVLKEYSYTHPAKHPASIIEEEAGKHFISMFDRLRWDDNPSRELVGSMLNDMSQTTKEDYIRIFSDVFARIRALERPL